MCVLFILQACGQRNEQGWWKTPLCPFVQRQYFAEHLSCRTYAMGCFQNPLRPNAKKTNASVAGFSQASGTAYYSSHYQHTVGLLDPKSTLVDNHGINNKDSICH